MSRYIHPIFLFFLITLLYSCGKNSSLQKENSLQSGDSDNMLRDGSEYLSFSVGKQQFVSQKLTIKKGELSFSVYEIPQAYFLKNKKNKPTIDLNERILIFEIKSNSHKRVYDYCNVKDMTNSALSEYLSFKMGNDIFMERNEDTTFSSGMIYEPSFSVTPIEKFIFFINDSLRDVPFNIIYEDRLFGTGISSFELNKNLKLKLNNNYDI